MSLQVQGSTPDNTTLTYSATNLPPGLNIDPTTGVITGSVSAGDATGGYDGQGDYTVTISVTDGTYTGTTTFIWSISPRITVQLADQLNREGDSVNVQVQASTPDSNVTLTYGAANLPGGLSINSATGVISGTLSAGDATGGDGRGHYVVMISVTDGRYTGTVTMTWTVTPSTVVWEWVATGSTMQSTDNPSNWLVGGVTPLTAPPNDGSVDIKIDPGTAPMEMTSNLTIIDSILVPTGWNQTIQLDDGLEITGNKTSVSTINNATLNILNAPRVIDAAAEVDASNLTTISSMGQVQTTYIAGKQVVEGEKDGNHYTAKGPVDVTGQLVIQGNNQGWAFYTAGLGVTIAYDPNTMKQGEVKVSGASEDEDGILDTYTLTVNGANLSVFDYGTVSVTGTLKSGDDNFLFPSMIVNQSGGKTSQIYLHGEATLTTEYGLYIGAVTNSFNILQLVPTKGSTVTLNGDVYTYGDVNISALQGGGSISSDGNITINNATHTENFSGAANSPVLWTCKTFTGAGTTGSQ